MALTTCRECRRQVSDQARACPRCGAPQPAKPAWSGTGFEWKSSRTCLGYPLVHIAFGRDSRGKLRLAKGVIAIGQFAVGLITVAQFGVGLLFGFGQFLIGGFILAQFAGGPGAGGGAVRHRLRRHRPDGPGLLRPGASRPGRIPLDHVETRRRSGAIFSVLVGLPETACNLHSIVTWDAILAAQPVSGKDGET